MRFEGLHAVGLTLARHSLIPRRSGQVEDRLYEEDFVYASPSEVGLARLAASCYRLPTP
jgi:hypothetical protein